MAQPVLDAEYIFGLHESGGESYMLEAGKPGWILFSEAIGHDPNDRSGKDYSAFEQLGLVVMVCLNHGYYPQGTLPDSSQHGNFARRCANFVAASRGCHHWIVGNEMNYAVERPGVQGLVSRPDAEDPYLKGIPQRYNALHPALADPRHEETANFAQAGEVIVPERYARCYRLCRNAIHTVPGHTEDRVLVGAVCPWNSHTIYPGNPHGDWLKYFQDILVLLGPDECDGFTLHAYTHGAEPSLILDDDQLSTFPSHAYHFQVYRDFMQAVPANMRHLPAYITEANQDQPWENANTGWVREAYAEIDRWNREPDNQKIRALILHRWPRIDRWHIEGKPGVIRDFVEALRYPFRWQDTQTPREAEPAPEDNLQPFAGTARQQAYRVQWAGGQLPQPLHTGQIISFPLTVRNVGTLAWAQQGVHPVRLSYRLYQNRAEIPLSPDQQLRSPLPHDVPPGESATIEAQVALPQEPGNYTLIIDLVHEGVTWFQDQESDVLIRWMTVLAPTLGKGGASQQTHGAGEAPLAPSPMRTAADPLSESPDPAPAAVPPAITDITSQLPRNKQPYRRRSLAQVQYLVISHTGAPPIVPLQAIAQAHIAAGYPGIAYQYVVAQTGEIFQVSAQEETVNDAEWSAAGINVALEGNFDAEAPPPAQLEATAHLCTWLLGQIPQVTVEQIVGLCELIPTNSPGATFLEGPAWRQLLRQAVQAQRPRTPALPQPTPATEPPHTPAQPLIQEITAQLPRDPQGFFSRRPEDIHRIVVNHTGMPAHVPLEEVATAFRTRGWPGILYHFCIADDGSLYQTQPILQVADDEKSYIANAIHVAFAGDFDETIPTAAQLEAGGALMAWLLSQYPQLSIDDIQGVSELISHDSPGKQWLQGRRWKDRLLQAVQTAPTRASPGHPAASTQTRPETTPRHRMTAEVGQRLQRLEQENDMLRQQVGGLRAENDRLRREIEALRAEPLHVETVPPPVILDAANQLPRHPALHYDERRRSAITHIAIHHTALPPHIGPDRIAELHIGEDPGRGKRPWPGIGYHFFVHADGRLVRTQPLERIAYHVAGHNEYSLGVVFAGSFMNGAIPTPEQLSTGAHLLAWLLQELRIPLKNVWGHQEFPDNRTVCPGSEWLGGRKWRDRLFAEIVRIQRGEAELA